jgi:hypothetical protein
LKQRAESSDGAEVTTTKKQLTQYNNLIEVNAEQQAALALLQKSGINRNIKPLT